MDFFYTICHWWPVLAKCVTNVESMVSDINLVTREKRVTNVTCEASLKHFSYIVFYTSTSQLALQRIKLQRLCGSGCLTCPSPWLEFVGPRHLLHVRSQSFEGATAGWSRWPSCRPRLGVLVPVILDIAALMDFMLSWEARFLRSYDEAAMLGARQSCPSLW